MRLSSGYSDIPIAVLLLVLGSCASTPPASHPGERFSLRGSLRVEGDQPFHREIVLSDGEGVEWKIDPGRLEPELVLLDGYEVSIRCRRAGGSGGGKDAVAESYRLVPPGGMTAARGRIVVDGGAISLGADKGLYRLTGPLSDALRAFAGQRAWVWGAAGEGGTLDVRGYEVIGPP